MPGERVLLVDDEAEFVEALSIRLENRGLVVDTAANGSEALEKVRDGTFDAIVLDLAMPGMNGIETLEALKDLAPNLQIILLTGHGNLESGIQAMKLGAMDFLEKPVGIDVLLQKIRQAKANSDEFEEKRIDDIVQDILVTKGW